MRRRILAPKDSLDLLLDTMCNAFGGIVLIAILVALLIQTPGSGNIPVVPAWRETAEAARNARELVDLEAEIAILEEKREANRELIDLVRRRNELEAAAAERRASGNLSNAQLHKRLGDLLGEKSEALDQLGRASASLATVKAELLEKKAELVRIEGGLEDFIASRVAETRPPELRDSSGSQFNFILRYGEIYPLLHIKIDGAGEFENVSENDDSISWQGSVTSPIKGSGMVLGRDQAELMGILEAIRRRNEAKADFPSEKFYIALFVYGDSFHLIDPFRALIDDVGGIRSGWEPWADDEPLGFSSEGRKSKTE
jgi:hypothetical protein